jgi:small subunit ribosomal protein S6
LRDYEILFIVRPELDEEQLGEAVKTVDNLIANLGGTCQNTNVWGKRRLAYEVDRLREGHYVLTDFELDPNRLGEMEATLKISETVFRHLIVRKPEKKAPAKAPVVAPAAETPPAVEETVQATPTAEEPAPAAPAAEATAAQTPPAEAPAPQTPTAEQPAEPGPEGQPKPAKEQ